MKFSNLVSISLLLLQLGCMAKYSLHSAKVIKDGEDILFGPITVQQLFFDFPEWKMTYTDYRPDAAIIKDLKSDPLLAVEIFFGTWCDDSQREVPHFLKIIDLTHFCPANGIYLYAVDRQKQIQTDLCKVRNIDRVATFIFYRYGQEIGRIVENPYDTLEKDIKAIISTK